MKLLIDYGSTRLKWATLANAQLRPGGVFAHADVTLDEALAADWSALPQIDGVLVASVVTAASEAELAELARATFGIGAHFIRSPHEALGVRNAYARPQDLGIDRFLAMVALHANPRAQVLVSVGTGLTIDLLAVDGCHLGGVIGASPNLNRAALLGATARVEAGAGRVVDLADNTADALTSGTTLAAVALIERTLGHATKLLGSEPALVLTGGGADPVAAQLPHCERVHDLVLRGLERWAEHAHAG